MAKMQEGKVNSGRGISTSRLKKKDVQCFLLQVSGGLRRVEAPQGGTRWHKGAGDSGKVWCEAKNEDGSRLASLHTWE